MGLSNVIATAGNIQISGAISTDVNSYAYTLTATVDNQTIT